MKLKKKIKLIIILLFDKVLYENGNMDERGYKDLSYGILIWIIIYIWIAI